MIKESLKLRGKVSLVIHDKEGNLKDSREIDNLIVQTGLDFIASRMAGAGQAVMSHMALGQGTTGAANGNTDLETMLGSRKALSDTTVTNNEVEYTCSFASGEATGAVTEAGIFNASTAGSMLCRTVFSVVNKGAEDVMSITWTITVAAS